MSKIELEQRIWHWAGWCIQYEKNTMGWQQESPLYRFLREGFTSDKSKSRGSSLLYNPHPEAEEVQNAYNQLKKEDFLIAETMYVYYVFNVSIRRIAAETKVNWRTVYKRLETARKFISERIVL